MAANLTEANKKVIGAFAERVFVKKDLSAVDQYVRSDYIQHNPLVKQGASGFREFFSAWFASVPDWQYTLKKIVAETGQRKVIERHGRSDAELLDFLRLRRTDAVKCFRPKSKTVIDGLSERNRLIANQNYD